MINIFLDILQEALASVEPLRHPVPKRTAIGNLARSKQHDHATKIFFALGADMGDGVKVRSYHGG